MAIVKIEDLKFSHAFYPRREPSGLHISQLADAIGLGVVLPPIIIRGSDRTIIDGWHRANAWRKVYGPTKEIEVEEREYESDAEAFIDAVRLNCGHGLSLSTYDKAAVLLKAAELGISREAISGAFYMPLQKVEKISFSRTAFTRTDHTTKAIALKGALKPLRQQTLTTEQNKANDYCGGLSAAYYCSAVLKLIEAGVLEWGSDQVRADLKLLHELLDSRLVKTE